MDTISQGYVWRNIVGSEETTAMEHNWNRRMVIVAASFLLAAVLLSACQQSGGDPFQSGQFARQQVDIFLEDAGRFVAGFCSASLLPGVFALGIAWLAAIRSR